MNRTPRAATSIDDIDSKVCNAIHNINACTPEELEELGKIGSYPRGDEQDPPAATSIDDIDSKVCNAIHNINACTPEELEELGIGSYPRGDEQDPPGRHQHRRHRPQRVQRDSQHQRLHRRRAGGAGKKIGSYPRGDEQDPPAATSIDDIDPNVCNAIHNINACTPEELEELGNRLLPPRR